MNPEQIDEDAGEEISKSQRKREADAIRDFAARLVNEPPQRLKRLPLSEPLREAIANCPAPSTRGAYKRHIQYIGKMIRKAGDFDELQSLLEQPPARVNPHMDLCNRLIQSFTDHADALRQDYPQISLQQARQLAKAAAEHNDEDAEEDPSVRKARNKKAEKARQALLKLLSDTATR